MFGAQSASLSNPQYINDLCAAGIINEKTKQSYLERIKYYQECLISAQKQQEGEKGDKEQNKKQENSESTVTV